MNSKSIIPGKNQSIVSLSDSNALQELGIRKARFIISSDKIYTLEFDQNIEIQELKTMIQKAAHLKKNSFSLFSEGCDYTSYSIEPFDSVFPDKNLVTFTIELNKGEENFEDTEILLQINTPCPEHDYKFLLYYCFDCGTSICSECFTKGKHKGHKIKDKFFYLLPSKFLVEKMFENWSKMPYEDYQIYSDLNEYKNNLNNTIFHKLFEMLKQVQNKCNYLIDEYNKINQVSLSNIRNSIRDIKVSCIKALDEYKDAINIKDIINNQEIFLDFDLTYNQLGDKQKEKLKENLLKFQELNKGISILIQNYINDIYNNINDMLVKALDNKQYEEIYQKINLKKIKPVNKDDIINQINDRIIKIKLNKKGKKTMNNPNILGNGLFEEYEYSEQNSKIKDRNTIIPQNHSSLNKFLEDHEQDNNHTYKENNLNYNNRSLNDTNGNTNLSNSTSSNNNNGIFTNIQIDNKKQYSNLNTSQSHPHKNNFNQNINLSSNKNGAGASPFVYNNKNNATNPFEAYMDKEKNNSNSNPFLNFNNKEDNSFLKDNKDGKNIIGNKNINEQKPTRNIFSSALDKNFINNDDNNYFNSKTNNKNSNSLNMNNSIHDSYNDNKNSNINNSNISNKINQEEDKKETENSFSSGNIIDDTNSKKNDMTYPFTNINSNNYNNNNYNDENKDSSLHNNANKNQINSSYLLKLEENCKTILEGADESASEISTQKEKNINIEYYLNKPFILCPIQNTTKIKIVTDDETEENTITLNFPENFSIPSFLNNCSYCNHNKKLYISGGIINSFDIKYSNLFFMIDLYNLDNKTNSYIYELSHMKYGKNNHSMIGNGNEIYVVGGENSNIVEKYDIINNNWIELNSMVKKRSNAMLAIDNDYLYAFFGKGEKNIYPESIERLNIKNNNSIWEIILFSNPNNIDTRCYGCGIYQIDELIYFFGGKNNEIRSDEIFFFNILERVLDKTDSKLNWKESFKENKLFNLGKIVVQILDGKYYGIYLNIITK